MGFPLSLFVEVFSASMGLMLGLQVDRLRRILMVFTAVLLLSAMTVLDLAHFHHHYLEAAAHADGDEDYCHDERECDVFHAGLLSEAIFDFPLPETPAGRLSAVRILQRPVGVSLDANAPRAPPLAS